MTASHPKGTILVTGGAGYIGSHTCVELLGDGYDVVVVDNFVNSRRESLARVERIAGRPVACYEADVRDEAALARVFDAHPITGGPTLPTIDCFAQLLRPGEQTQRHRHTSSAVYYVVEGQGTTQVGDQRLHWSTGDSFVIPNWMWHQHINRSPSTEAVLFSATDAPLLTALGMYREEPHDSFGTGSYPAVPADAARGYVTK